MKHPPPSSPRAAGARAYQENLRYTMKRKAAGASARASARVLPALGGRLHQIFAGGVPAWAPSMLGVIRLGPGRGRRPHGLSVEPRHRRRGRGRNPGPRGGGEEDQPGRGGGGEDRPGGGGGALRDPENNDLVEDVPHEAQENYGEVMYEVERWMGIIDKEDLAVEDNETLYEPYLTAIGDKQFQGDVVELNIELGQVYCALLDDYIAIYKAISNKWKLKRNLENLPWEQVQLQVKQTDCDLKVLLENYKEKEKHSVDLMQKIYSMDAEPLQPPPMLGRHPGQYDSRKEKRSSLRNQKRQATMAERKRLKKEKRQLKEVECFDKVGSKKKEKKAKLKEMDCQEKVVMRKNKRKCKKESEDSSSIKKGPKKTKSGKKA